MWQYFKVAMFLKILRKVSKFFKDIKHDEITETREMPYIGEFIGE
mgnify:CR=1 FL=1